MTTTLISHFYNEEYLLPWWLMHHTQLFDHGILINRGSTDRSVEICRQFAPHWEVRDSRVPEFDAILVDQEVIDIEKEVPGWKMVLNTTEFLCCQNKSEFFTSLISFHNQMHAIRLILMVDPLDSIYSKPRYSLPLVKQRYHGYFPYDPHLGCSWRLIHNYEHGSYTPGRHSSSYKFTVYPYPVFVLKFYFSPWNDAMRKRRLQIAPTLSARWQWLKPHYTTSLEELETKFIEVARGTQDLRSIPEYQLLFPDL
ncbi:glycosyltransferase family 2 protein [Bacillus sp. NPDC094077]|uniref:glycosyltransferase family 2 protein n=1 Tax=Bacillus sp. NPDC094077 TaxID=3390932 RepID=UPI003CFDC8CA